MQAIKQPEDMVIQSEEMKFRGAELPREALFSGFIVDSGGAERNEKILERLAKVRNGVPPDEIVMEGRLSGREQEQVIREYELQETPFAPFAQNFEMSVYRLSDKYSRYKELQRHDVSPHNIDLFTYRDSIFVDVAAMCTENERRENYTIKVYLRRQNHIALYAPIEGILNRKICVDRDKTEITVAKAIKILRNKFICHFDNFEDYDMTGREGLSDGKWTPGDRIVLSELLLPVVNKVSPLGEIIDLINKVVDVSSAQGQQELQNAIWENLMARLSSSITN